MFNLAHVILKNPNDKVKVRAPHSWTWILLHHPSCLIVLRCPPHAALHMLIDEVMSGMSAAVCSCSGQVRGGES